MYFFLTNGSRIFLGKKKRKKKKINIHKQHCRMEAFIILSYVYLAMHNISNKLQVETLCLCTKVVLDYLQGANTIFRVVLNPQASKTYTPSSQFFHHGDA